MNKKMTCIECPKSCMLSVDIENCKITKVTGAKCPRGVKYAISELDNPMRILTSTVVAQGLPLKLVPVRTDKPIPKKELSRAMDEIRKITLIRPVKTGDVIIDDLLSLGVKLIATREVFC